jgi:hypothetical protein
VLNPPWRQRFEGSVDNAGTQNLSGGFVANLNLSQRVLSTETVTAFQSLVVKNGGK